MTSNKTLDSFGNELPMSAWVDATVDPAATGNTGTLPRYVNNTVNGTRWIIDAAGVAKKIYSAPTPIIPELVPVLDFKTAAELAALASGIPAPNDGASYIVRDGANKSNIATWDGVSATWVYYSPSDLEVTTVTAPALSDDLGKWKYDEAGDFWYQVQQGIVLPEPAERPLGPANLAWSRTTTKFFTQWTGGNGIAYIQNDRVTLWGNNANFTSGGAGAENAVVRKMSWNWMNGVVATYAPNGYYVPKFTAVVHGAEIMLATDHLGKVWAAGSQVLGTGITTTPLGTVATATPPNKGFMPIPFFQAKTGVFATRLFMNNYYYALANRISGVLDSNGDLWVAGYNGHGALGQGNTTATAAWVKYPLSNVVDVHIGTYYMLVLTADGTLYYSGNDASGCIDGSTTNKTTPVAVATGVASFGTVQAAGGSPTNILVVKTDGTAWGRGVNANGELAMGHKLAVTTLKQVLGVANAKVWYGSQAASNPRTCLLRTDGTISFSGTNGEGTFGYAPHTAATTVTSFVQPAGAFQGTVIEVMLGRVSTVLTAEGQVWQAGITDERGLGFVNNAWSNTNKWQKTPLPEPVVAIRGFSEAAANTEGYNALTPTYGVVAWGRNYPAHTNASVASVQYFSPREVVETRSMDNGIDVTPPFAGGLEAAGSLTGITSGSVTNILDGATVTVTATLNVTGTRGTIDLTGATLTGTGVTSTLITKSAYLTGTPGTIQVSFKVIAADLIASGGADNTQNWVFALGSLSTTLTSTRMNDAVQFSLNGSSAAYVSAADGAWVPVTEAEYNKVVDNVAGADYVGHTTARLVQASTGSGAATNFYAQATLGSDSEGTLPANHYLVAVAFKPTAANATVAVHFGNATTPNTATYTAVGPTITAAPIGNVFYVRKKPPIQASAGVIGIKGSANLGYVTNTAPTVGYYGPAAGSTTPTNYATNNAIQLQGIATLTKPY